MPIVKKQNIEFNSQTPSFKTIDPVDIENSNDEETYNVWQNMYTSARPYLQTALESGGSVAGMAIGAAAGHPVTGDALGYAAGAEALDALDVSFGIKQAGTIGEEFREAGQNIMEGYTQGLGGQILGSALQSGAQVIGLGKDRLSNLIKRGVHKYKSNKSPMLIPVTARGYQAAAGRELAETRPRSDLAMTNWAESSEMENVIPGLHYTRGQKFGTPDTMLLEDTLIRSGIKLPTAKAIVSGQALAQDQKVQAQNAIYTYFKDKADSGTIKAFIDNVFKKQARLETASAAAGKQVRSSLAGLDTKADEYTLSSDLVKVLRMEKKKALEHATSLYDKVPDISIEAKSLKDNLASYVESEARLLEPRALKMLGLIDTHTDKSLVSFQALRKIRSRINRNIKAASGNVEDIRQLKSIKDYIKTAIDTGFGTEFKFSTDMAKKAKETNKKLLTDLISSKKLKETSWYRGTNIPELEGIIKNKSLLVGQSAEGHAGISAYKAAKDTPVTMQGSYDTLPVAIIGDKTSLEGVGQGVNEVLINPKTDPTKLLYLIDGSVSTYDDMTKFVNNYNKLQSIDKTAAPSYKKASTYYRDYASRFKEGTVADVLAPGARGEETKIPLTKIGKRLTSKEGIRDYIRAAKKNPEASKVIDKYMNKSFHDTVYDSVTDTIKPTAAFNWVNKNAEVLNKLGTKDDFYKIAKQIHAKQVTAADVKAFVKPSSLTGKVLQTSTDNLVKNAFSTSKDFGATAVELRDMVKGDPKAIQGLRKALTRHIMDSSKVPAEGFIKDFKISYVKLDQQYKKFMPALQVLYKAAPAKLNAVANVHKAFKILNRDVSSLVTKQPTAFDMFSVLAKLGGTGSLKYPISFAIKKLIQKHSDSQIKKLLLRATLNPDYAMGLEHLVKSKNSAQAKEATKEINNIMSRLTVYAEGRLTGDEDEK